MHKPGAGRAGCAAIRGAPPGITGVATGREAPRLLEEPVEGLSPDTALDTPCGLP